MLVAIKKFKESDDNEYVSVKSTRSAALRILFQRRLFKYNQQRVLIGEENGLEGDPHLEVAEARPHRQPD